MSVDGIVKVMSGSVGQRIRCVEKNGASWTGIVDVYESAYDNEDDEVTGESICVRRDDGNNVIVYVQDIKSITMIDG